MAKQGKNGRSRTKDGYISFIVDDDDTVKYLRKGVQRRRRYIVTMHRNNYTGRYCALFGYYLKDGSLKRLWLKATDQYGFASLKDELMHRYHNHIEILLGQISLVKVRKSILDEGGVPGMPNGKGLPVGEGYDVFKVVEKRKGKSFDLIVEGVDGRKFKVSSDCMTKAMPANWIENIYAEK